MSAAEIDFVGEGRTDAELARRLIRAAGGNPGTDFTQRPQARGKDALGKRLLGYSLGAGFGRAILVLRDLDRDAPCAGALVAQLLPERHPACLLRIAVRSVEAWLMADVEGFASAAKLRAAQLPVAPESLEDPKRALLQTLRQSRNAALRKQLDFTGAGPTHQMLAAWTADFVRHHWSPQRAMASGRVPSLERCFVRLCEAAELD